MDKQPFQCLKFKSSEELKEKVDSWLKDCQENKRPLTITGLCLALDTNRETLLEYEKTVRQEDKKTLSEEEKKSMSDIIRRAKLMCQNFAEEYLFSGKTVVGAIFNLKNNYGWKDESGVEVKGRPFLILDKNPTDDNTGS